MPTDPLPTQPPFEPLVSLETTAPMAAIETALADGESAKKISSPITENGFALAGDPSRPRLSRGQLAAWAERYGTKHRQLRRWLACAEPAPLDDPTAMPAWWSRNMDHTVPAKILAAAKVAREAAAAEVAAQTPPVESVATAAAILPATEGDPLDLSAIMLTEGSEVLQAARLVAAAYGKLERAYAQGSSDVDHLQRRWEKAQEALRRAKGQEEEMKKRRREWIPRAEVQRDIDLAVELLRQMRSSMVRRVHELCKDLNPAERASVAQAIEQVRGAEERVFRNLKSLQSPNDVVDSLAA